MNSSASGAFASAAAEGEAWPKPKDRHNIKQYKGLVDNVQAIKEKVDRERRDALDQKVALLGRLEDQKKEANAVQKELSVQLRVAGRSYENLLSANRELTDNLRAEAERRLAEVEPLKDEIKALKKKLTVAQDVSQWKDQIAKRDIKIARLQDMIPPLEQKIREERMKMPPVIEKFKKEIALREDATESVLREIAFLKAEFDEKEQNARDGLQSEKDRAAAEIKPVREELEEIKGTLAKATDPFKKEIKELNNRIIVLEKELSLVDYKPYERKIDIKENAYNKLVRDFEIKENYNKENVMKMREGFEDVISRMDKRIKEFERERQALMKPFEEALERKEEEVNRMQSRLDGFKVAEAEHRARDQEIQDGLKKELKAAKEAVEMCFSEATKAKQELAKQLEALDDEHGPWKRMRILELKLEDVTQKCQHTIEQKDKDLKLKTEIIQRLQLRMREDANKFEELDRVWDKRVQTKEEGYQRVSAELSYAEGQIVEERKRTAAKTREVKARERDIVRLKEEHTEELRVRLEDHEALEKCISELEAEKIGLTKPCEEQIERLEANLLLQRQRSEADITDLRVEIDRRDKARVLIEEELAQIRGQYDVARASWEEKERELEKTLFNRERQNMVLKNEIEFINDSWEIKYNNLLTLFERLQRRYDEVIGPNGAMEAHRRIKDLKEEINLLNSTIEDLKEQLKKQKRRIRDLELDIDGVKKETADLLYEKERGMAEIMGDMAKLRTKLRETEDKMEQLLKEKDAEKVAIVESFQTRVDHLEQLAESLRFTDRQELVDRIEKWKKAYERVVIQRDDMEEELTEQVDVKDTQVMRMAEEYNTVKEKMLEEEKQWQEKVKATIEEWQLNVIREQTQTEEVRKRVAELEEELAKLRRDLDRAIKTRDTAADDEEKAELRRVIEEKERNIAEIERGLPMIIEENRLLSQRVDNVAVDTDAIHDHYKSLLEEKDAHAAKMQKEHQELKDILEIEMYKAQEACKTIEEQVKKFPNPFEVEVKEMRDKYVQMQAGMMQMSLENIKLREDFNEIKEAKDGEIKELELHLETASGILQEIAGIGVLQQMSEEAIQQLEEIGVHVNR